MLTAVVADQAFDPCLPERYNFSGLSIEIWKRDIRISEITLFAVSVSFCYRKQNTHGTLLMTYILVVVRFGIVIDITAGRRAVIMEVGFGVERIEVRVDDIGNTSLVGHIIEGRIDHQVLHLVNKEFFRGDGGGKPTIFLR